MKYSIVCGFLLSVGVLTASNAPTQKTNALIRLQLLAKTPWKQLPKWMQQEYKKRALHERRKSGHLLDEYVGWQEIEAKQLYHKDMQAMIAQ